MNNRTFVLVSLFTLISMGCGEGEYKADLRSPLEALLECHLDGSDLMIQPATYPDTSYVVLKGGMKYMPGEEALKRFGLLSPIGSNSNDYNRVRIVGDWLTSKSEIAAQVIYSHGEQEITFHYSLKKSSGRWRGECKNMSMISGGCF